VVRPIVEGLYDAAGQIARALATVVPAGGSKLSRTLQARRGVRARYAEWASRGRAINRPLLWVHAPSVGEGLQARPVLEIVRRERPDVQLAYTYFSPSAVTFAASLDVDFRDYLPFDTAGDAIAVLAALRPAALVFSKLDVWPTLALRASERGVHLGLVSATVSAGSARSRDPVRWLMRPAYARLDLVGAIAPDHAERLVRMGVRKDVIRITGDTRHDQVWARAAASDRSSPLLSGLSSNRPTLVAGSTWPADELMLLPAWADVRARVPHAQLIIAPHEPSVAHLADLERALDERGWSRARLTDAGAKGAGVIIVDRMGLLGDLYALADAAYVGGGFHAAGLHSVLEPAAFGAPVLFGPRFSNSRDAEALIACDGGITVSNPKNLADSLVRWLGDATSRGAAGDRARQSVRDGLGAAERSAAIVLELLDRAGKVATG